MAEGVLTMNDWDISTALRHNPPVINEMETFPPFECFSTGLQCLTKGAQSFPLLMKTNETSPQGLVGHGLYTGHVELSADTLTQIWKRLGKMFSL